jgi:hypothetical protein
MDMKSLRYNGRSLLIQVCPGSCQGQPIGVEDHC